MFTFECLQVKNFNQLPGSSYRVTRDNGLQRNLSNLEEKKKTPLTNLKLKYKGEYECQHTIKLPESKKNVDSVDSIFLISFWMINSCQIH